MLLKCSYTQSCRGEWVYDKGLRHYRSLINILVQLRSTLRSSHYRGIIDLLVPAKLFQGGRLAAQSLSRTLGMYAHAQMCMPQDGGLELRDEPV